MYHTATCPPSCRFIWIRPLQITTNPPYQEMYEGESSGANSVYDRFIDSAIEVSDKVELIHPARFLFNAGSTAKTWNQKMLDDPHFKVAYYEPDSDKVFPNLSTPIKGGVAVTFHDNSRDFGAIGTFTPYQELNTILHKVKDITGFTSISSIIITSFAYHFTEIMHNDHPEAAGLMSKGHANDLKSNVFDRLSHIFYEETPCDGFDYIEILGRQGNDRAFRFIRRDYINSVSNLDYFKVFISKANGAGIFGETLSDPIIGNPGMGSTETFLSIGSFAVRAEAEATVKYVKTKFARALLGVLKVTQDITPSKWKYVPLQDFTPASDIDWSVSIANIDRQLYKKYELSQEEIDFIEKNVKEME